MRRTKEHISYISYWSGLKILFSRNKVMNSIASGSGSCFLMGIQLIEIYCKKAESQLIM